MAAGRTVFGSQIDIIWICEPLQCTNTELNLLCNASMKNLQYCIQICWITPLFFYIKVLKHRKHNDQKIIYWRLLYTSYLNMWTTAVHIFTVLLQWEIGIHHYIISSSIYIFPWQWHDLHYKVADNMFKNKVIFHQKHASSSSIYQGVQAKTC